MGEHDYKELIEEIRDSNADGVASIETWATAIETLLAERNALLDALRGSCSDCVFRETKKCEEPCVGCYHAPQHFCESPSADSGLSECWQWHGTGGSDGEG